MQPTKQTRTVLVFVDLRRQCIARYTGRKRAIAWTWEGYHPITTQLLTEIWAGMPQTAEEAGDVA